MATAGEPRLLRAAAFSTEGLPPERQFAAWRDQCAALVEMIAPLSSGPGFAAAHQVWDLGGMALSRVRAPAATWRRTAAQIRRDSIDHWVIGISRGGEQVLRSANGCGTVPAGIPYGFSLNEPIEGRREDMDWIALFVSRDLFPERAHAIDAALHAPLDGPLGRLLGTHIEQLAMQLPRMTEADLPHAAAATRALIGACMSGPTAPLHDAAQQVEGTRLARIKAIIRRNIASPSLGPRRLCQLGEVSRSQLYRLFTPLGGVARYIQAERLRQAERAIADPADRRDIARIAEGLGFYDASSFSRAFRREFGITPRDLRAAAQAGLGGTARPPAAMPGAPPAFTEILRRM
ncbi:helix-turn-helix domain-containing protein [Roseomonas sp. CECT 9278]|uniref:helix-turn-helix domain-containing protein n=1 Tax=Roseomonas sp. CECT 9278 TaxID=2845823 RepID=UPI001E42C307|nr:helix-turn-helix domain-containing protein [Roseomonas sp. CECT 9278]